MKLLVVISLFLFSSLLEEIRASDDLGTYFYKDMGCTPKDGNILEYECPDFSKRNNTCRYKNKTLQFGESVDKEFLKGSCHAACHCGYDGIVCAHYDCFERLKSGCSHFKYSLDGCCAVDSVCGPIEECQIEGETYKEGNTVHLKKSCQVCVCDVGFKMEAPFCRQRICYDQATHPKQVANFGAPVFFKDESCCPTTWTSDEGEKIIKMNPDAPVKSDSYCKYGENKVQLGYGFQKKIQPYGRIVPLKCECSIPPYVICREEV